MKNSLNCRIFTSKNQIAMNFKNTIFLKIPLKKDEIKKNYS